MAAEGFGFGGSARARLHDALRDLATSAMGIRQSFGRRVDGDGGPPRRASAALLALSGALKAEGSCPSMAPRALTHRAPAPALTRTL